MSSLAVVWPLPNTTSACFLMFSPEWAFIRPVSEWKFKI
jgi:hypothetical protein